MNGGKPLVKRVAFFLIGAAILLLSFPGLLSAAPTASGKAVYWVPVDQEVERGLSRFLERALSEAEEAQAEAVVLEIDTLGGEVGAALEIGKSIRRSRVPVIAYIRGEAISAGAYISLNADQILMSPGSAMGAAEPRTFTGDVADPKVVASWTSIMRAAAEQGGRDGDIAAAMVDRNMEIKGLKKKGELLSLSAEQAVEWNMADRVVPSANEVLPAIGLGDAEVIEVELTPAEKVARWVTSPYVVPILLMLGLGGIALELFSPGFGVPGAVGLISFGLYFFGHYMAGLAGMETVLLFVAGIILMVVELFVPGWGIFGILGLISLGSAVVLAAYDPAFGIVSLVVALTITGVGIWIAVKVFGLKGVWSKLILKEAQENESGYVSSRDWSDLVGKEGITLTPLRPAGWVQVEGEKYDVVSEGGMIPAKTPVKVLQVEGSRIVVRRIIDTENKSSEEEQ